jgi:hypothetical protein
LTTNSPRQRRGRSTERRRANRHMDLQALVMDQLDILTGPLAVEPVPGDLRRRYRVALRDLRPLQRAYQRHLEHLVGRAEGFGRGVPLTA